MSTWARQCVLAAALVLVAGLPASALGGVVYSNFGPGNSYNMGAVWQVDATNGYANQFTATANFTFTDAIIPMIQEQGTNLYQVSLASDSAGSPGAILETIDLNGVVTSPQSLITVTSSLHPTLSAGLSYWLIVSAPDTGTIGGFYMNSIGDVQNNNFAFSNTNTPLGPWTILNAGADRPAFEIDGTLLSPVPEPSSLLLAAASISIGFIYIRARRSFST